MDSASKGSETPAWDGEEGDQPGLASPGPSTSGAAKPEPAGRAQAPKGLVFSKPWCPHLSNGVLKLAARMRSELNETKARTGLDAEHTGFFYAQ